MKLSAHPVKTGQARQGLPGNEYINTGSAFLPAPAAGRRGIQPTCPRVTHDRAVGVAQARIRMVSDDEKLVTESRTLSVICYKLQTKLF